LISLLTFIYFLIEIQTIEDGSEELGIEIDLQVLQLTFRSAHLQALTQEISQNEDIQLVFDGAQSIQAALIETAQNRDVYELVGRDHQLEHWYRIRNYLLG
jgi:hypothetical protein